ncbi:hypothetical protein [Paraburkholderia heleia]|uniref:hypothetical protein n=1 Tax=Paraburkholderia heleia TaxID=634127 RepID=UPI002AB7CE39|nr:hypothetical protein [Paraburkholderia heleia]
MTVRPGREWIRAQRTDLPLSLVMARQDIDGTSVAEPAASRTIARWAILDHIHRNGDVTARASATEYAILLPATGCRGAEQEARNI